MHLVFHKNLVSDWYYGKKTIRFSTICICKPYKHQSILQKLLHCALLTYRLRWPPLNDGPYIKDDLYSVVVEQVISSFISLFSHRLRLICILRCQFRTSGYFFVFPLLIFMQKIVIIWRIVAAAIFKFHCSANVTVICKWIAAYFGN